jgi:hypothetical protein
MLLMDKTHAFIDQKSQKSARFVILLYFSLIIPTSKLIA